MLSHDNQKKPFELGVCINSTYSTDIFLLIRTLFCLICERGIDINKCGEIIKNKLIQLENDFKHFLIDDNEKKEIYDNMLSSLQSSIHTLVSVLSQHGIETYGLALKELSREDVKESICKNISNKLIEITDSMSNRIMEELYGEESYLNSDKDDEYYKVTKVICDRVKENSSENTKKILEKKIQDYVKKNINDELKPVIMEHIVDSESAIQRFNNRMDIDIFNDKDYNSFICDIITHNIDLNKGIENIKNALLTSYSSFINKMLIEYNIIPECEKRIVPLLNQLIPYTNPQNNIFDILFKDYNCVTRIDDYTKEAYKKIKIYVLFDDYNSLDIPEFLKKNNSDITIEDLKNFFDNCEQNKKKYIKSNISNDNKLCEYMLMNISIYSDIYINDIETIIKNDGKSFIDFKEKDYAHEVLSKVNRTMFREIKDRLEKNIDILKSLDKYNNMILENIIIKDKDKDIKRLLYNILMDYIDSELSWNEDESTLKQKIQRKVNNFIYDFVADIIQQAQTQTIDIIAENYKNYDHEEIKNTLKAIFRLPISYNLIVLKSILKQFKDYTGIDIEIHEFTENVKASVSRNIGFKLMEKECNYACFCDDDDFPSSLKYRLEICSYMRDKNLDILLFNYFQTGAGMWIWMFNTNYIKYNIFNNHSQCQSGEDSDFHKVISYSIDNKKINPVFEKEIYFVPTSTKQEIYYGFYYNSERYGENKYCDAVRDLYKKKMENLMIFDDIENYDKKLQATDKNYNKRRSIAEQIIRHEGRIDEDKSIDENLIEKLEHTMSFHDDKVTKVVYTHDLNRFNNNNFEPESYYYTFISNIPFRRAVIKQDIVLYNNKEYTIDEWNDFVKYESYPKVHGGDDKKNIITKIIIILFIIGVVAIVVAIIVMCVKNSSYNCSCHNNVY